MSDFSLSTFLTSGVITVIAAILAYMAARMGAQRDLRAAEELAALTEYSEALEKARQACDRLDACKSQNEDYWAKLSGSAYSAVESLGVKIDSLRMRLPAALRQRAAAISTDMGVKLGLIRDSYEEEGIWGEISALQGLGKTFEAERDKAEESRAQLIGH